jgi:predicted nucleotidyltransferase
MLIGSLARGDWSARSDADVVVIMDHVAEPGPFCAQSYAPRRRIGVAVDVLVYTPDERATWSERFRGEVTRGIVLSPRPQRQAAKDS